jgi:ribosomal protein S1
MCGDRVSSDAAACPHCAQPTPLPSGQPPEADLVIGRWYDAVVRELTPYGAFVTLRDSYWALLHISEMSTHRVERPEEVVRIGQTVKVRVTGFDNRSRIKVSLKSGANQ